MESEEFQAEGRGPDDPFDDDLDSAYVEDGRLDLAGWARDAIAESVPALILCREDCAGLCPTCGANRNEVDCGCVPDETDPRWDALRGLSSAAAGTPLGERASSARCRAGCSGRPCQTPPGVWSPRVASA